MGDIEFLLMLLTAAAVLVRLAELASIPYPIVLVLGGLAIGLVPGLPEVAVEPDAIFLIFLPPLLHAAGWYSSPQELRAELRPLLLLSVGLVLATMVAVALLAHAIVPGMSWAAAFMLGAIVGPTDPVSATATFSRLGAPARVRLLVEGEAMVNDATALVAFRVAVAAAVSGTFSASEAALDFIVAAAGGIAVGLAVGWASRRVLERQTDTALTIFFSVLVAYLAYIAGEELHVSGVLAVVVAGLYGGWNAHATFGADTRLSAIAFWKVLVLGLEALLFVLLGLQAPVVAEDLEVAPLVAQALAVAAAVIALRAGWVLLPWSGFGDSMRERVAIGWAGMRGAISLAAALAVPTSVPERPQILLLTFGVIFVTLIGQGLTLAPLLRVLRLRGDGQWSPDEAIARLEAAQAALDRLEELAEEGVDEEALRRLRERYRARFALCVDALGGTPPDGRLPELRQYAELRRDLIATERSALLGLRDDGRLRPDVMRTIQRDLDLEEARIRG